MPRKPEEFSNHPEEGNGHLKNDYKRSLLATLFSGEVSSELISLYLSQNNSGNIGEILQKLPTWNSTLGLSVNLADHSVVYEIAITEELRTYTSKEDLDDTELQSERLQAQLRDLFIKSLNGSERNVTPDYRPDAMNEVNRVYYSQVEDAFKQSKTRLASFFRRDRAMQYLFSQLISESTRGSQFPTIVELCAGKQPDRWVKIFQYQPFTRKQIPTIVLSDFSRDALPSDAVITSLNKRFTEANVTYHILPYDLRQPIQEASQHFNEKANMVFTTYGFDSVWLDGDEQYEMRGSTLYRILKRLYIRNGNERSLNLLAALRGDIGSDKFRFIPQDFVQNLVVESIAVETNFQDIAYGYEIEKRMQGEENKMIYVPGGLISKVLETFEHLLKPDGYMVIAEAATTEQEGLIDIAHSHRDIGRSRDFRSGSVARYKVEDFSLAADILQAKGFTVEIINADDYVRNRSSRSFDQSILSEDDVKNYLGRGQIIIVIRKK